MMPAASSDRAGADEPAASNARDGTVTLICTYHYGMKAIDTLSILHLDWGRGNQR